MTRVRPQWTRNGDGPRQRRNPSLGPGKGDGLAQNFRPRQLIPQFASVLSIRPTAGCWPPGNGTAMPFTCGTSPLADGFEPCNHRPASGMSSARLITNSMSFSRTAAAWPLTAASLRIMRYICGKSPPARSDSN